MTDREELISALNAIPVSGTSYEEWLNVGMALKNEGLGWDVWDEWSRADSRYHPGECERKWASFKGSATPVTAGTIFKMAMAAGWKPSKAHRATEGGHWNSEPATDHPDREQANELKKYLSRLFEPDDMVGYVTDALKDKDGKWRPGSAGRQKRAADMIEALGKGGLDAAVGRRNPEAGAWIRFNPLDGKGAKDRNVTRFRYALVESDSMPIEAQLEAYRRLRLPIAAIVHSGGKSAHAIVRIDASCEAEYRQRVERLYAFLKENGVEVDTQNRNPSRLSRMPGVARGGTRQRIIGTSLGMGSWQEWIGSIERPAEKPADEDGLPPVTPFEDRLFLTPPPLAPELIHGVLRRGHKMLVSGSSKAGKSFLLMELATAIAEGFEWIGFKCEKGKVLYMNLEIDPNSCVNRLAEVYRAMGLKPSGRLDIWNLRGHALPLDRLCPKIIDRMKGRDYAAVIIDPIYKVITGDENNASDMGRFCNQFDRICNEAGCAAIYCHHHSKGAQGSKKAMDRASGSGVFARDPDAQLDLIQLEVPESILNSHAAGGATAWRIECSLREFRNFTPKNIWFEYPIHRLDTAGVLEGTPAEGSLAGGRAKNRKYTASEERKESVESAYQACSIEEPVTVKAMAEYLGITARAMSDRIKEQSENFWLRNGIVGRKETAHDDSGLSQTTEN